MHTRRTVILCTVALFLATWLATPSTAVPCSCLRLSIEQQVEYADYVFAGLVVDVDTLGGSLMATVVVDEVWKGAVTRRFEVWTLARSASCGYNDPWARFEIGSRFLLFAYDPGWMMDEIYTGLCTRNAKMADAAEDLAFLGPGHLPVDAPGGETPGLFSAFPNPGRDRIMIPFYLPSEGLSDLTVHDMTGRMVAILSSGLQRAGYQEIVWDCSGYPAGAYVFRMSTEGIVRSRWFALVK